MPKFAIILKYGLGLSKHAFKYALFVSYGEKLVLIL